MKLLLKGSRVKYYFEDIQIEISLVNQNDRISSVAITEYHCLIERIYPTASDRLEEIREFDSYSRIGQYCVYLNSKDVIEI